MTDYPGAGMTNRDMERERERRDWEQSELQDLDDLQAKHARIDERLEVSTHPPLNSMQSPSMHLQLYPEDAPLLQGYASRATGRYRHCCSAGLAALVGGR